MKNSNTHTLRCCFCNSTVYVLSTNAIIPACPSHLAIAQETYEAFTEKHPDYTKWHDIKDENPFNVAFPENLRTLPEFPPFKFRLTQVKLLIKQEAPAWYRILIGQKYIWKEDEFTHSVMGFSKENPVIEKLLEEYLAKTYGEDNFIILKIGNEKTVHRIQPKHS